MIIKSVMGPKKQIGVVTRKDLIVESIYELDIKLSEICLFKPGQYVSLKVNENGVRRSYSVAGYQKNTVRLLVDVSPGGMGSIYLEKLSVGDEVEVMGFLGRFVLEEAEAMEETTVYFVATGTGIAPFLPMIEKLLLDGFGGKVILWWGLRFIRGLYWQKWLQEIKEKYKNFDFEIYMSQPESLWTGKQGHVGDNLDAVEIKGSVWYLCGSTRMIEEMKSRLREKQVPEELINYEKFF